MEVETLNPLFQECEKILERAEVPKYGDRSYYWVISPELDESYLKNVWPREIFGYQVEVEYLAGEHMVTLMHLVADGSVEFEQNDGSV